MLDSFFNRAEDSLIRVVQNAIEESVRQKSNRVGTEHLLFGLARETETVAGRALVSMKIDAGTTQAEVEQYLRLKELSDEQPASSMAYSQAVLHRLFTKDHSGQSKPFLSDMAMRALARAQEYSYYFGQQRLDTAHLLLGILDLREAGAAKIFEELSANLTFLRRQVMRLLACEIVTSPHVTNLREAVIQGLKELVDRHDASLSMISELSNKSGGVLKNVPSRCEVLHMVCVAYLGDFLYTQVAFQRYLLEETMALLISRAGPLDKETSAAVVACTAQNIRAEVRATIEYLWSHEFRLIHHMFDDAEHDLIGSLIEDLWWAQSEEMALDESFASALEDHRRTQLLNLQKRRIEITHRLVKLKGRLDETLKQCFLKRSVSA
ncbi:MAG: hypothetical protein C5B53_04040 [Candidatus Melainabacteria bacterium]|nr:MAG: hypothetical protein C5B53_04040 [Candidatus Melainabacteria bacterium]